ncbi:MAG: hypothetical protein U5L46_11475 [Agrobacterium sp.]|nr:hypothetical protein [Agrobacterium sp.]
MDVSKDWLDAFIRPSGTFERFGNDAAGIGELAALCRAENVELVVMEASGGYERAVFLLLWELGIACALANPRQVRHFAGTPWAFWKRPTASMRYANWHGATVNKYGYRTFAYANTA